MATATKKTSKASDLITYREFLAVASPEAIRILHTIHAQTINDFRYMRVSTYGWTDTTYTHGYHSGDYIVIEVENDKTLADDAKNILLGHPQKISQINRQIASNQAYWTKSTSPKEKELFKQKADSLRLDVAELDMEMSLAKEYLEADAPEVVRYVIELKDIK